MIRPACFVALLSFLACSQTSAQPESVYVDIAPCLVMTNDADRHACYIARGEGLRSARAGKVDLAVPAIAGPAAGKQQQAKKIAETNAGETSPGSIEAFGLEPPLAAAHRESNARVLAIGNGALELTDTITSLDERMPNLWEVTLSNGQVWRQVNTEKYRLREGMQVRIYPSTFAGAFRMSAKGINGFIQVRRIR